MSPDLRLPGLPSRRGHSARVHPLAMLGVFLGLVATLGVACTSSEATSEAERTPTSSAAVLSPTATITPPASDTEEPVEVPEITIAAVGDLMFARDVVDLMVEHGALYPFERVLPLFEDADLVIGNLEGTFTDRGVAADKVYTFRAPPGLAEGLALAGFDAVSLANNHSYDFGLEGLEDTLTALDDASVRHAGAGMDAASATAPALLSVGEQTVALLSFNDIERSGATGSDTPGVAWAGPGVADAVSRAAREADYVVVMLHAGTEYSSEPTARQQEIARMAIDAGADVVVGHHPHVLQPWECYRGGLIIYSLGNFVFDLDANDLATLGRGPFETVVAMIHLRPGGPPTVDFRPVVIDVDENRPRPAAADEARGILAPLDGAGQR